MSYGLEQSEIGLDHDPSGISTDSARGPETTGNNRHVSDNAYKRLRSHSRVGRTASRVHDRYIRRSGYRTSSPVTVRPISIRWISDVPSKMVKILECMGGVIGIPVRGFRWSYAWGTAALSCGRSRVQAPPGSTLKTDAHVQIASRGSRIIRSAPRERRGLRG